MRSRAAAIALAIALATCYGGALAAEPQLQQAELGVAARDVLAGIERDMAAIDQLREQAKSAGSEERAILERRRVRASADLLARINEFVEHVTQLEREGTEARDLRTAAEKLVLAIDPLARKRIAELGHEIASLGVVRDEAAGEARTQLEARISSRTELLRKALQATFLNIRNMHSLELDAMEPREHLAEVLTDRAENTLSRLDLLAGRIESANERLLEDPKDAAAKSELEDAKAAKKVATSDLSSAIEMLRELGRDTTRFQQAMIRATGELSSDILDVRVALGLARQWLHSIERAIVEKGPGWVFKLLLASAIVLAFHLLGKLVQRLVRRGLSVSGLRLSQLVREMVVSTLGNLIRVLGVLIALSQIGFSLGPVLAGFGIAGFIAGFALQETLANFASGMMILIYRPFDVGDVIEAGGVAGTVRAMSMVSTRVLTADNQTLIVPNGKIWRDVIKNVTAEKIRRVDLVFVVSHENDVARTEDVLTEIVRGHPRVLKDPAPIVKLNRLGESTLDFIVRPWVRTQDYWDVYWDVTRQTKLRFDDAGIHLPQPPSTTR